MRNLSAAALAAVSSSPSSSGTDPDGLVTGILPERRNPSADD
jgi:hypothetical protein